MSDSEPDPVSPTTSDTDAKVADQDSSTEETSPAETTKSDNTPDSWKRVPFLNSLSDTRNVNPSSTPLGLLGMARNPSQSQSSFVGKAGVDNAAMAKARALHQSRQQSRMQIQGLSPGNSPPVSSASSVSSTGIGGGHLNGFSPGGLRRPNMPNMPNMPSMPNMPNMPSMPNMTAPLHRPGAVPHKSAPVVPKSLAERRANLGGGMRLPDMGSGSPSPRLMRPNAPKLPGMSGRDSSPISGMPIMGSKLEDFKKYIDTEKGWITFDGAATITRTGVNFSNGQTFSISLDEVEVIGELGKGNYGTVYKVKHAKRTVPRFGHGLSGHNIGQTHRRPSAAAQDRERFLAGLRKDEHDGMTGKIMAMKEIRLELDDSKFTTILKELVILHECVSPYIIDFYGAFFQEGAVYICIEHMDGGSIDKLYAGGIPESILQKITYSAVMGLKSLKDDHNIIHRDVKPTNILANSQGQVKICDFGVSGNLVASIAKTNIGCQSYMAPERISGGAHAQAGNPDGSYNVQSDIWSLGLTIIECAIGHYPYPPETSSTIFSQLSAIVEGEPPNLPEAGYSDNARDFVKSCLHKIPNMRATYATLLQHPWLQALSKPATIKEDAEENGAVDKVADAVDKLVLNSTSGDEEVANWVKSVMQRKEEGLEPSGPTRPALHAAPLDSVSPLGSPLLQRKR